nr:unnamed protein product [Digitaria exilis]
MGMQEASTKGRERRRSTSSLEEAVDRGASWGRQQTLPDDCSSSQVEGRASECAFDVDHLPRSSRAGNRFSLPHAHPPLSGTRFSTDTGGSRQEAPACGATTYEFTSCIDPAKHRPSAAAAVLQQLGVPNLGPKLLGIKAHNDINPAPRPSKSLPSLRVLGTHPARGKQPPSSGWFPSRSRLGGLEGDPHPRADGFRLLAIQARARLDGNSAQRTAVHQSPGLTAPRHHLLFGEDIGQIHSRQPNPASGTPPSKAASKETMERRTQDTTLDAVNCHEKEGRYQSWKARFPLTHARNDKHMYSHPAPLVYKRGGKAHAKGRRSEQQTRRARNHAKSISLTNTRKHHSQGLRSSPPSPTLLVNPYYEQHATRCIAPLLDVRPRGRNQDKTLVSHSRHRGNEWLAPQSLVGAGATKSGTDNTVLSSIKLE